jgi:hypothetical protein
VKKKKHIGQEGCSSAKRVEQAHPQLVHWWVLIHSSPQGLELYPTLHGKFPIINVAGLKKFGLAKREGGRGAITKGRVIGFISLLLFALQLPFLSFSLLLPHGKHALYNIHVVLEEKIIRSIHTLVLGTLVLSCLAPC